MSVSIKLLEEINSENVEDETTTREVKKNLVLINNYCLTQHINKGEKEMSKYFLDMANKFMIPDYEAYSTTKNNTAIYLNMLNHHWNARSSMQSLLTLNTLKKIEDFESNAEKCI
jgi:hypothetical protein